MLLADKYHGGVPTDRRSSWHDYEPPSHPGVTRPTLFTRGHSYCANHVASAARRRGQDLSATWREQTPRQVRFHSAEYAYMAALAQMLGATCAANVWLVRGTVGNDSNGGSSQNVQATGTAGVTNGSTNTLVDATANAFLVGMVGQGICITILGTNHLLLITAYTSASTVTYSGANLGAHTGLTWTVGGAWKTSANAIVNTNSVAAGDSIYIGAGVYRTVLNPVGSIGGSSSATTSVIGDIDGAQTSDAGQVTLTAYINGDRSASSAGTFLALGSQSFINFSFLTMIQGTSVLISNLNGSGNWNFSDCTFNCLNSSATTAFQITTAGTALNLTFDRCTTVASTKVIYTITLTTVAAGGDYDAKVTFRNSFVAILGGSSECIEVVGSGSAAFKGGGVRIYGSTIIGGICLFISVATTSIGIPCEVHNSLLIGSTTLDCPVQGQIVESNNWIIAPTPRANVAVGPGSVSTSNYAPTLELGQSYKWSGFTRPFLAPDGLSSNALGFPFLPEGGVPIAALSLLARSFAYPIPPVSSEGVPQPLMAPPRGPGWFAAPLLPLLASGAIGGTTDVPVTPYDWANRPRPAGGGSNNPAAGYLEFHDSAVEDTVTYNVAPASAKLNGPGDIDILVPVDAVSNTFSIFCLYDSAYGGQNWPTITLLSNGEIGVVSQVAQAPGAMWGTWQQITLQAFTPTAAGFVKVRLTSYDLSGTSQVHFDTFAG